MPSAAGRPQRMFQTVCTRQPEVSHQSLRPMREKRSRIATLIGLTQAKLTMRAAWVSLAATTVSSSSGGANKVGGASPFVARFFAAAFGRGNSLSRKRWPLGRKTWTMDSRATVTSQSNPESMRA